MPINTEKEIQKTERRKKIEQFRIRLRTKLGEKASGFIEKTLPVQFIRGRQKGLPVGEAIREVFKAKGPPLTPEQTIEMATGFIGGPAGVIKKVGKEAIEAAAPKIKPVIKELRQQTQKALENISEAIRLQKNAPLKSDPLSGVKTKADYEKYIDETKEYIHRKIDKIKDLEVVKTPSPVVKEEITTKIIPKVKELGGLERERGFIASAREAVPQLEGRVGGQYIPRDTDELAIKAKNLIKSDVVTAENIARSGTDDNAVATASELIKHYGELAKNTTGPQSIAFYDKAAEIANELAPKLTEQGRSIQAASILGRLTPEGQLRFAAREIQRYNEEIAKKKGGLFGLRKKIPELTGEQSKQILEAMNKIKTMPDGVDKAIAFKAVQNDIADLIPSTLYQKIIAVWKAGLLTGLKTSGLNTFSNLSHGTSEIIKDIPAVVVDKVTSLFTKERTLAFTTKGIPGGVKEGFQKGIRYFKTGYDERNIGAKLDYKKVNFGKSPFAKGLQTYEEKIFQMIGAQDQPFYYGAKARSLHSQAIAQAKNQGLKGEKAKEFIDNLVANPTDKMLKYAVDDAEISVFQNKTLLGDVARKIQRIPGGEVVVPFGRTPASVATQMINYSPVGIVKTIVENMGRGRFDQRLFSQGIGRGVTGTGVMYIGMKLFDNDLISLGFPKSDRERRQWELEGRKANSIKIGGKWRSIATLGPAGNVLVMGGYLQQGINETGSFSEGLLQSTLGGVKSLTEQTFLQGVESFVNAITDPKRYAASWAKRTIGSVVPTIVSDIAQSLDPYQRQTKEGILAPLKARIPGVRETLPLKIDILGSPLERMGNAIETMIDPTRPSKIKSSVVIEEFRRLAETDNLPTPTSFGQEKKKFAPLTSEQRVQVQERAGQLLEDKLTNIFSTNEYQELDDEGKAKEIQKLTETARGIARLEMTHEILGLLEPEEMFIKLQELKESGFLTKELWKKYQKIF